MERTDITVLKNNNKKDGVQDFLWYRLFRMVIFQKYHLAFF